MPDLSVTVRDRDIIVAKPSAGFSVTYRKVSRSPMLVAIDSMRYDPDPDHLKFLVRAWRAAFEKAKTLGWLN